MTLTFLDLYNSAASQEWSMYDNDAAKTAEFEQSLVIDLNKAIAEIVYFYPFSFRERTHIFFAIPGIKSYSMPKGLIQKNNYGEFCIKINSHPLRFINNSLNLPEKEGIPEGFYIRGSKLILYPTPNEKFVVSTDYLTLAIGQNKDGEEIFALNSEDDVILIPEYLEEIFKNAVISRTMLNSIASEGDENYSAYKKQSETYYRQLVKYSKGIGTEKMIVL